MQRMLWSRMSCLLMYLAGCVCYAQAGGGLTLSLQQVAASSAAFADSLYTSLSDSPGNLFFSPLSIHTILSLTSLGAHGHTATQMEIGLSLPADRKLTAPGFRLLLGTLQNTSDAILDIANKIYMEQYFHPKPSFIKTAQQHFYSDVESVDFARNPEVSRQEINSWVEENTNDKIQNLLPSGFVDSSTVMVLVNTVYFKGSWTWFDQKKTSLKPFHVDAHTTVYVNMMYADKYLPYKDMPEAGVHLLQLPYMGEEVSLIVALPYEMDGLARLEDYLYQSPLSQLATDMYTTKVRVWLPKFTLEQTFDLEDALSKLGMVDMFSAQKADFSGISDQQVAVSKVVHKAFIEVDERGTEAAAATGVGIMLTSIISSPPVFNADHPFVFLLRHNPTGVVLFMGRLVFPQEETGGHRTDKTPLILWPNC